jgi:hypothetical protein
LSLAGIRRSLATGALIGLALGVIGIAALVIMTVQANAGLVDEPTKIVAVFAVNGEDGSPIAHTVAIVVPGAGESYYTADTSATVEVPGISASRLAEMYPVVGAKGVAAGLDGGELRGGTAWIDVPPAAWERLMAGGLEVTLAEGFSVFDGERLIDYPAGTSRVSAKDLRGLANGMAYLPYEERKAVSQAIAKAAMAALRSAPEKPDGVTTNLSRRAWAAFAAP